MPTTAAVYLNSKSPTKQQNTAAQQHRNTSWNIQIKDKNNVTVRSRLQQLDNASLGMQRLILIFCFFMLIGYTQAQAPKSWLIYFGQTNFKEGKYTLLHEFQYRDHQFFNEVNQLLFRVGFRYRVANYFSLVGGYAFVHTEAEGVPDNAFMENRIFQQATFYHHIFGSTRIRHRMRLEQRFMEGQDYSNRFRYCLFADIPVTSKGLKKDGWYASLYDEVFLNLADNEVMKPFDRNRAYAGVGYKIKDNLGLQLGYMRQHVGSNAGTNHVFVSVHHQIGL